MEMVKEQQERLLRVQESIAAEILANTLNKHHYKAGVVHDGNKVHTFFPEYKIVLTISAELDYYE